MILYFMARHGVTAGTGCAVEYAGEAIRALPIAARMTLCNMSIEFGSRCGIILPGDTALRYVADRPFARKGAPWDRAVAEWRTLLTDDGAQFDREIEIDCSQIGPQVNWGNSPQEAVAIDEVLPDPATVSDSVRRQVLERAYSYMNLAPGRTMEGVPIDVAFIGSCTTMRMSKLCRCLARSTATPSMTLIVQVREYLCIVLAFAETA